MDPWGTTLQHSLSAVHSCLFVLFVGLHVHLLDQVVAFEDSGNTNNSTTSCAGNRCPESAFHRRLQSGLTIGAVCLVLMVGGGLMFAHCIRKLNSQPDDITKKRRKKKNKRGHGQKQNHSKTVFTISNEQCVAMEEFTTERSDKVKLVFPDVVTARQSRHHMEDTFNSYGKPVDCEDQRT